MCACGRECQAVILEAVVDAEPLSVTEALLELGYAALSFPELDPTFDEGTGDGQELQQNGVMTEKGLMPAEEITKVEISCRLQDH